MNKEIMNNQEENKRIRINAILDRLNIPEKRRNKWADLWCCFPEKKWESMEQIWIKVLQRRNLPLNFDNTWIYLENALKRKLELEEDEAINDISSIEERNGRLFECEERRVWEYRQLDHIDYEILILEEKWELYIAVCCLVGYIVVSEVSYPSVKHASVERDLKKCRELYKLVLKSIKNGELQIEGEISKYSNVYFVEPGQGKCFVNPYNFLKWALLKNIYIPRELQLHTGLFQHESLNEYGLLIEHHEIQFCKNSDNSNKPDLMNSLACQAISQVLWYLDPSRTNISIELEIKNDFFFNQLTNASKYKNEKTLWGWIKKVDPQLNRKAGRPSKQNPDTRVSNYRKLKERAIDCTSGIEIDMDCWCLAYSFQKFKQVVFCHAFAFFHKNQHITPEEVLEHPVIQQYFGAEFCLKMIRDWVYEAYSYKKSNR